MSDLLQGTSMLIIAICMYVFMAMPLYVMGKKCGEENA